MSSQTQSKKSQPHVPNPSAPQLHSTQLQTTPWSQSLMSFGQNPGGLGLRAGFMRANKVKKKQLNSGVLVMHVGGSGSAPQPALQTQRRKEYPRTVRVHQCAQRDVRPWTLGQRGELQKKVGRSRGLQRSGRSESQVTLRTTHRHGLHTRMHT